MEGNRLTRFLHLSSHDDGDVLGSRAVEVELVDWEAGFATVAGFGDERRGRNFYSWEGSRKSIFLPTSFRRGQPWGHLALSSERYISDF